MGKGTMKTTIGNTMKGNPVTRVSRPAPPTQGAKDSSVTRVFREGYPTQKTNIGGPSGNPARVHRDIMPVAKNG